MASNLGDGEFKNIVFLLWIDRLETETTRQSETGNQNAIRNKARGHSNQPSSRMWRHLTILLILRMCNEMEIEILDG